MSNEILEKLEKLKVFLETQENVLAGFLFGSYAKDITHRDSDIDIAIYFKPETNDTEYEEEKSYKGEDELWSEIEKILEIKTDMVVLNRASSTLADSIIKDGKLLVMKDSKYFSRFSSVINEAAEYYRDYMDDFIKIKERSNSLSITDKERLIKIVEFLEQEIKDFSKFRMVDQIKYQTDRDIKRSMERWVENIVNSSVDISKIILASEKKLIPNTYKSILENLIEVNGCDLEKAKVLGRFAKIRNILAHEYLDLRFNKIKEFIAESESCYTYLVSFAKDFIKKSNK
jgi:uncharacterized protein YutE (UPF0331/DUF86 family)/predicted nucleotidyltransferase